MSGASGKGVCPMSGASVKDEDDTKGAGAIPSGKGAGGKSAQTLLGA